jgi:hypothetical protein
MASSLDSVRSRVVLLAASWLSIGVFSAYLVFTLFHGHAETLRRAQAEALTQARLVEEHATATIERANLGLLTLAERVTADDLQAGLRLSRDRQAALTGLLVAQQQRTRGVVSMSLTNNEGVVIANSVGTLPGVSLASRKYFQDLQRNVPSPVISEAILGRVSNKWGIQVARRLEFACWSPISGWLKISTVFTSRSGPAAITW